MKDEPKKPIETSKNIKRTISDLPQNLHKSIETPEELRKESQEEEKTESFNEKQPQKQDTQSQTTCLICFDKDADAVIMDCGHGGICYGCCIELFKKKQGCYLCRKPILQVLQIEINKGSGEEQQIKVISCTKMKQKQKK